MNTAYFGKVELHCNVDDNKNIVFSDLNINWNSGSSVTTYQDAKDMIASLQKAIDYVDNFKKS